MATLPPSRMTKPQLIEELAKLKERGQEIAATEKELEQKSVKTLFEKGERDLTKQALVRSFGEARAALGEELEKLLERALAESAILEELRRSIGLSHKELELAHGKEIAARSLADLMGECEEQKKKLITETAEGVRAHEETKRHMQESWKREQEEYGYAQKRDRARDAQEWKELAEKRELALIEREDAWKTKEARFAEMEKLIEKMPKDVEKAATDREMEVNKRLRTEHEQLHSLATKEWEAEKAILELRLTNLADQLKKQTSEAAILRVDLERANAKAQELALAVITSNTPHTAQTAGASDQVR